MLSWYDGQVAAQGATAAKGNSMGDMYEHHASLADQYRAGLITVDGQPVDNFDTPDEFETNETSGTETPTVRKPDPARPDAKNGRYYLPNPDNGKSASWQRVTNFVKMTDDTYHLELWKQRNVVKGLGMLITEGRVKATDIAKADVKEERNRLNAMATKAQELAEAYKMADEGTALHTSTELADYAGGDLNRVPSHHRPKVRMYLDALAANGLRVADGMIERVIVSTKYGTAGKLDRIFELWDGTFVIGDLKTGDSIDLALPSIAGQLQCYEEGANAHGIWDGRRYVKPFRVRTDFAIVVHLPSTRDEVSVHRIDLAEGRKVNAGNLTVRETRKIKAKHVSTPFDAAAFGMTQEVVEAHWIERLNAAWDRDGLVAVAGAAKSFGQWNERLAGIARSLLAEMNGS